MVFKAMFNNIVGPTVQQLRWQLQKAMKIEWMTREENKFTEQVWVSAPKRIDLKGFLVSAKSWQYQNLHSTLA